MGTERLQPRDLVKFRVDDDNILNSNSRGGSAES